MGRTTGRSTDVTSQSWLLHKFDIIIPKLKSCLLWCWNNERRLIIHPQMHHTTWNTIWIDDCSIRLLQIKWLGFAAFAVVGKQDKQTFNHLLFPRSLEQICFHCSENHMLVCYLYMKVKTFCLLDLAQLLKFSRNAGYLRSKFSLGWEDPGGGSKQPTLIILLWKNFMDRRAWWSWSMGSELGMTDHRCMVNKDFLYCVSTSAHVMCECTGEWREVFSVKYASFQ